MEPQFVYRAFHRDCSGTNSRYGFKSGRSRNEPWLDDWKTLEQHFELSNRYPTPWISTTDDLLRAITIAIRHHESGKRDVRIAVINVEACQGQELYLASDLASENEIDILPWHDNEYLFRWQIPRRAIVACLFFQTLLDRGLYDLVPELCPDEEDVSVDELRGTIQEEWLENRPRRWHLQEVGRKAAELALIFGYGEHVEYIAEEVAEWWEPEVGNIIINTLEQEISNREEDPKCFG